MKILKTFDLFDTNILDPEFSSGSFLTLKYYQKFLRVFCFLQDLFGIKTTSVLRQLFQKFTIDPVFLIKGFSKDPAFSTLKKEDFLSKKIPIFENLYISTNIVPLGFGWDFGIISLVKKMVIKLMEFDIIIKNNLDNNNSLDNKNILNTKKFLGENV